MGVAGTTHINDVLTNTTNTPIAITYVVTPVSASGCTGTARNVVITVNPSPVLAASQSKTICSGANVGLEILMNPLNQPTGTVFNWPDPDGAGPATAGVNVVMGPAGTVHINDALTNGYCCSHYGYLCGYSDRWNLRRKHLKILTLRSIHSQHRYW